MTSMFGFCKSDPSIPIEHLDYKYIETCQDSNKLRRILEILRSGEEGSYPALEEFTEKKLAKQKPKSSMFESINLEKHFNELSEEEKLNVLKEINEIKILNPDLVQDTKYDLPPIRSNKKIDGKSNNQSSLAESMYKKRVAPRSYDEWASLEKDIDNQNNICNEKSSSKVKICSNNLDASKILENEDIRSLKNKSLELQILTAQNEKLKGNEAFRSGDFKEALVYYNRSLEMQNQTAVYNNRAITYIKLERYQDALADCNLVLKEEPTNLKAYLRRGISNEALHRFHEARDDYQRVLDGEPRNKRALELLSNITKKVENQVERKGKRLKVEEINTETEEVSIKAAETNSKDEELIDKVEKINSKYDEKNTNVDNLNSEIQKFSGGVKVTTPISNNSNLNNDSFVSQISNDPKNQILKDSEQQSNNHEAVEREIKSIQNKNTSEDFMEENYLNNLKAETCQQLKEVQNNLKDLTLKNEKIPEKTLIETFVDSNNTNCTNIKAQALLIENEKNSLDKTSETSSFKSHDKTSQSSEISSVQILESFEKSFVLNEPIKIELPNQELKHEKEIPIYVITSKDEANKLFYAGNYVSAAEKYTLAIKCLSEDSTGLEQALATLLCNRAACYLKSGHCDDCITDCTESINLFPTLKAFLRRAAAFETLEKYTYAYVDYEVALQYDHKAINTQQALTRIAVLLKMEHGLSWRNVLPASTKINFNSTLQDKSVSFKTNDPVFNNQLSKESLNTENLMHTMTFNELKELGNQYFKQGKIKEAIDFYSRCIVINPQEVASYTNRALCFLKMGDEKLPDAISDCKTALNLEPNNVKALFRRALAYKASKCYKEALSDFSALLKIEPKNTATKDEIEICKELYRKTLQEIQLNTETKKRELKGKRINIEEVTSAENHSKVKHEKNSAPKTNLSAPPKKMSGFEFLQAWSIKTNKSSDHAELLKQIDIPKLPELLSNKLDGEFLQHFIRAVHDHFTNKESFKVGVQLLKHLSRTSRFVTILLFLNTSDKTMLKSTIELLELRAKNIEDKNLKQEVFSLRTTYKL
ncbi:sperm-associated antigen 1 isoform X2 [Hydra vulgaris]|uniref:sperm-associated antigen 1 isoform X2 n=1 Tax=Hydra vulgaris TaxID=6087 RepID=UPI001F5F4E7B|nr:sperm-associated antigen 1 isoform X2 [Hydra vulgaris]